MWLLYNMRNKCQTMPLSTLETNCDSSHLSKTQNKFIWIILVFLTCAMCNKQWWSTSTIYLHTLWITHKLIHGHMVIKTICEWQGILEHTATCPILQCKMAFAYWIHKCVLANKEIMLFSKVQKTNPWCCKRTHQQI